MTPADKIIEDLKKSGFASEMAALQVFSDAKWDFVAGHHFFDQRLNQSREIDAYAWLSTPYYDDAGNDIPSFGTTLLCDVKKSERPWVLLKSASEDPHLEMDVGFSIIAAPYKNAKVRHDWDVTEPYAKDCIALRNGWTAYGLHEAFKNPSDNSRWYSAAMSLVACADSEAANCATSIGDTMALHYGVMQPVIILDGELFVASIDKGPQLKVVQIEAGSLRFGHRNKGQPRHQTYLDIVTLGYLKEYLASFPNRNSVGLTAYLASKK